jgi:hypothetical protein
MIASGAVDYISLMHRSTWPSTRTLYRSNQRREWLRSPFWPIWQGSHAANPGESRSSRIDSRKPAIWFQLGMLRDATRLWSVPDTWVTVTCLSGHGQSPDSALFVVPLLTMDRRFIRVRTTAIAFCDLCRSTAGAARLTDGGRLTTRSGSWPLETSGFCGYGGVYNRASAVLGCPSI